ncbi:MAG: histidine--tRNA ligase [Sphingobacteriales bacterium]|nr:MAG: histidine--tRNA ligase [Sphingobacteriales bacterium]
MSSNKPSLPKGTRDFSPSEMVKRNFIFDTIKKVFVKYGYSEIQTPSMENLSTLTGKYGDEGDKLIFKILNSGEFLSDAKKKQFNFSEENNSGKLISSISEKALRYDLTVPFARYVVMHQNDIALPFKRFQVQPVWRADRPQKGRYREFYQCDVDVVGSESLMNEAEFILIYQEALEALGLQDFTIKINNRKILSGIADVIGKADKIIDLTVAIDKLDKIGLDGVSTELLSKGFTDSDIKTLTPIILLEGGNADKLNTLKTVLQTSATGLKGIEEIEQVLAYTEKLTGAVLPQERVLVDISLARGLNYYTGCIFEVQTNEVAMGSIGGGGRYDDLTGMFGLKGLTGAGISFGADRIYDVLEELDLFPASASAGTRVLLINFDEAGENYALPILYKLRQAGIAAELYPTAAKLKKQMSYADAKQIPFVVLAGSNEIAQNSVTLRQMKSGEQADVSEDELVSTLSNLIESL